MRLLTTKMFMHKYKHLASEQEIAAEDLHLQCIANDKDVHAINITTQRDAGCTRSNVSWLHVCRRLGLQTCKCWPLSNTAMLVLYATQEPHTHTHTHTHTRAHMHVRAHTRCPFSSLKLKNNNNHGEQINTMLNAGTD